MTHPWDPVAPPPPPLVAPVRIDPLGRAGPTRGRAQGPRWRRTSAGLYLPAAIDASVVEQRIVEAVAVAQDRAVVTAWAALRLHGGGFFDGLARDGRTPLPVQVAANGERFASRDGVRRTRFTVPDDEVVVRHGLRVASVERALFDEMARHRDPHEAVVAADMAFAAKLTSMRRMFRYCAERRWYRDVRTVRAALELCDEAARSPQETRFRLIWVHDGGWAPPLCNRMVLDLDGQFVAIPDLLDVERGIVGEYAGADHRDIDRHADDIDREGRIRAVGLEHVEVVSRDLRHPEVVVRRMLEAERRVVPGSRRWQLGPPATSLDEILDGRDARVE